MIDINGTRVLLEGEIYFLYHAGCYDGFGAAWAAWRRFGLGGVVIGGEPQSRTARHSYCPVNYGQSPPPIPDGQRVVIMDFSYPRDVLLALAARSRSLLVLDHHKTAQTDLANLPFAIFDMQKSGAVLAWEFFHPGVPIPTLLAYVQDRDLWSFALPESREVNAALRSWPMDFAVWDRLSTPGTLEELKRDGQAILRIQGEQVKVMADQSVWRDVLGHRVHVANATVNFSEVGEELCKRYPDEPFAAYYGDRIGTRQWGLRSRGGFDVSEVAKQMGGGGHAAAAGFVTDLGFLFPEAP